MIDSTSARALACRRGLIILIIALLLGASAGAHASVLDVDRDSTLDALTDGSLIVRYLLGYRDAALTRGAVDTQSVRTDPAQIAQHLQGNLTLLDIDGDGETTAQTDGQLILRYLTGLEGAALTDEVTGAGAARTTPEEILDYLNALAADDQSEQYPGAVQLVFASATGPETVALGWTPAVDKDTDVAQIEYTVHASTHPDFVPEPGNQVATLVGATETTIKGLTVGTRYAFTVVAIDAAGYQSAPSNVLMATTKLFEDQMVAGVVIAQAADRGLGIATLDGDLLRFPKGGEAPAVGTYLTGELADGSGYLRQVEAVTENASEWVLTTPAMRPSAS